MKINRILIMLFSGIFFICFFQPDIFAAENQNSASLTDTNQVMITVPPSSLMLDPFYKKYVDANGFPVISSWRAPDKALLKAREIIIFMTDNLPDAVVNKMRETGVKVGVMARYEGTTDIPEHKHLENDTSINWDVRARGLGGDIELPLTTCAEENLLCYQIDKYHAEDILIHEFAHTIHLAGILQVDTAINSILQQALDQALADGKWKDTYASTNIFEYWAEGVQDWFNVNAEVPQTDGKHNQINTRDELKAYDPELYAILKCYFAETTKCISCHSIPFGVKATSR